MAVILKGMRSPHGYACIDFGDGKKQEFDTVQCAHCQRSGHVLQGANPEDLSGSRCKSCMGLVCHHCTGKPCTPWEKIMDAMERDYERRRSYWMT
jgi:hypothetical protein